MFEISNVILDEKEITVPVEGFEGFEIKLAYINKKKVKTLIEKSTTTSFNGKTRQPVDKFDAELFNSLFAKETIRGWTGLTGKHLKNLLPVGDVADDAVVDYSEGNAEAIIASEFLDGWINDIISDVSNFNKSS